MFRSGTERARRVWALSRDGAPHVSARSVPEYGSCPSRRVRGKRRRELGNGGRVCVRMPLTEVCRRQVRVVLRQALRGLSDRRTTRRFRLASRRRAAEGSCKVLSGRAAPARPHTGNVGRARFSRRKEGATQERAAACCQRAGERGAGAAVAGCVERAHRRMVCGIVQKCTTPYRHVARTELELETTSRKDSKIPYSLL